MSMATTRCRNGRVPFALAAAALLLTACGGGGGGGDDDGTSNVPPPPPPPPATQAGVFKDRNVAGLAFTSGAESGVTDTNGRYTCETDSEVSFSVGGVTLGETDCATLVMPNQLATDDATFDLEVANLARFLQMLDEDGDPDNGIVISDAVQQIAENWMQVDFRTDDLAEELVTIISDATSVDGVVHVLPSAQAALDHLQGTVVCAYAGAYEGSISGSNSGAAAMIIGWSRGGQGFNPLAFDWQGIDSVNDFEVAGGGSGTFGFTIRQLPELDNTDQNVSGPIAVQFTTPDDISGTWEGGDLELHRIGNENGDEYRFVGKAINTNFDDRAEVYISLNFDGAAFSGEAFEVFEGTRFDVTGTLTGDAVSLTATGGGDTFSGTGTLTLHPDGSPDEAAGTFDDGSDFSIVACPLN